MASRERDQAAPRVPLLSSLVIRPSDGGGGAGDFESGDVHRDPPPYARSDRFSDASALNVSWYKNLGLDYEGYRIRAGSTSPVHRRNMDHHYSSEYDHLGRSRGFSSGRDSGRYRDYSPPYGPGRSAGRPLVRGSSGLGSGHGPFRGEGAGRNNPNVRPREGDWICTDPLCGYLNFARRDFCKNCNKPRFGPVESPRRGYLGPPPAQVHTRRFSGPPMDHSPGRATGYQSPPRGWARDGPREFLGRGVPPPVDRFPDHHARRDRLDYLEDDYRERNRFDRPMPPVWEHKDRGRENFNERKAFERQLQSAMPPPPLPPPAVLPPNRARWGHGARERSRSPVRGPPLKAYRRDMYMGRGRDDRRAARPDW